MNSILPFLLPFFAATLSVGPVVIADLPVVDRSDTLVAERQISLENRYAVESVNEVFKDNILLTIAYLSGRVRESSDIDWEEIRKPFEYEFTLNPNEVFAFHEDVQSEFRGKVVKTTNAHFNYEQGFKSSGLLYGDGVCHLASLLYWAAHDAGLTTTAPAKHDFANIPEIPSEFGVSIYYSPNKYYANTLQNLYIQNTFGSPVKFVFKYEKNNLNVSLYKIEK